MIALPNKPVIQVSVVGGSDYQFTLLPFPDGTHVQQGTVEVFPRPQPTIGQVVEENFLPYRHVSQHAPLGIGLKNLYHHDRVYDMEADARFPGVITFPRLITTTTFPAGVTAVKFQLFFHAIGQLFMGGIQTTGEPLLYWDGSNWADATLDADLAIGTDLSGGCDHAGRACVITTTTTSFLSTSVDTTTWVAAANAPADNAWYLVSDGAALYTATGTTTITMQRTADIGGSAWVSMTATIGATGHARGLLVWGDGSGTRVNDLILATPEKLYHIDVNATWANSTFSPILSFTHPESAYTGKLLETPHGIAFIDGPNVFVGDYGDNGGFVYKSLGPDDLDDGVPLEQAGNVTWMAYDSTRDELAFAKGGLAASRNQVIYFYSFKTGLISAKMGPNTTANRASFAGIYSSETDGRTRLHFTRDNGVANDSDAVYLDYISENPDVQTAATYATTGFIRRSRFNGGVHLFKKAFYKGQYVVDSHTTTENLSVKFATNGGALGSAQTTSGTGNVQELFADGSATAVGASANDIDDEVTMARDTTTTLRPIIRALCWAYDVLGLKSDGTPIRSFKMRVSLNDADNTDNESVESGKGALAALEVLHGTVPLVKLALGATFPVGSEVKVRLQPRQGGRVIADIRDQVDLPGGGSDGKGEKDNYELVEFREVI